MLEAKPLACRAQHHRSHKQRAPAPLMRPRPRSIRNQHLHPVIMLHPRPAQMRPHLERKGQLDAPWAVEVRKPQRAAGGAPVKQRGAPQAHRLVCGLACALRVGGRGRCRESVRESAYGMNVSRFHPRGSSELQGCKSVRACTVPMFPTPTLHSPPPLALTSCASQAGAPPPPAVAAVSCAARGASACAATSLSCHHASHLGRVPARGKGASVNTHELGSGCAHASLRLLAQGPTRLSATRPSRAAHRKDCVAVQRARPWGGPRTSGAAQLQRLDGSSAVVPEQVGCLQRHCAECQPPADERRPHRHPAARRRRRRSGVHT